MTNKQTLEVPYALVVVHYRFQSETKQYPCYTGQELTDRIEEMRSREGITRIDIFPYDRTIRKETSWETYTL